MTFVPSIPLGGNAGWQFLQRTRGFQQQAFENSPGVRRLADHFLEKIGTVRNVDQLLDDRRLLTVALGAFGLEGDLKNRAFIREVLQSSTLGDESLATRLADKRYLELAKAFRFGDFSTPNTVLSDFGPKIVEMYQSQSFEAAVGQIDPNMRLVLGVEREIKAISEKGLSSDGAWFSVLGSPPLRRVFMQALGLPDGAGALDVDRQAEILKSKSDKVFGSSDVAGFLDPERQEKLIRMFLIRSESDQVGVFTKGSAALALLQYGQLA